MKLTVLAVLLALACAFTSAEARPKGNLQKMQIAQGCSDPVQKPCYFGVDQLPISGSGNQRKANKHRHKLASTAIKEITHQSTARPRAWCGWFARFNFLHRDPGPAFNLARNWARIGSNAGGPAVGAIVVWRHHVGKIVGRASNGQWIVHSGNDSNRVRTRPRSVSNAIAFRWP